MRRAVFFLILAVMAISYFLADPRTPSVAP
jgi:hypothetical protein